MNATTIASWRQGMWWGFGCGALTLLTGLLGACASHPEYNFKSMSLDDTRCPAESQMVKAADSEYGRGLIERFSKEEAYPTDALQDGQSGDVHLCLRLSRDGVIDSGRLLQGSGFPALDGAALLTLAQLKTQPPPPKDFAGGKKLAWVALTVHFDPGSSSLVKTVRAADDRLCKETGTDEGDAGAQRLTLREWGEFPRRFSEAVKGRLVYPPGVATGAGATQLCVALDRNGGLLGATVSRSSGSAALDGASLVALAKLLHQNEVPPLPDAIREGYDNAVFTQEIDWAAAGRK